MDVPWFLLVVSAAVFISMVLLAIVCLDCRKKGPLVSIRETDPSDEYINPPPLTATHPFAVQPTTIRSPSSLLSPISPSADTGTHWRHRSVTPTETESNPSYENPVPEGPVDSDAEDTGYIIVLPDNGVSPPTNQSRASTPSLDQHDYENVPEKKGPMCADAEEDRDYLNVEPLHLTQHFSIIVPIPEPQNTDDDDNDDDDEEDDDDDSDDDEKGNYVNEIPPLQCRKQVNNF